MLNRGFSTQVTKLLTTRERLPHVVLKTDTNNVTKSTLIHCNMSMRNYHILCFPSWIETIKLSGPTLQTHIERIISDTNGLVIFWPRMTLVLGGIIGHKKDHCWLVVRALKMNWLDEPSRNPPQHAIKPSGVGQSAFFDWLWNDQPNTTVLGHRLGGRPSIF